MKSMLIPSSVTWQSGPHVIQKAQKDLGVAQREMTTGRWADVGLQLGSGTGAVVDLRAQLVDMETLLNTNSITETRVNVSQDALAHLVEESASLFDASVSARNGQVAPGVTKTMAVDGLNAVIAWINTSSNGVSLFSGINTDTPPLENFFDDPPPPSRQAVEAAFLVEFGFLPDDPSVATIDSVAMTAFLDGAFTNLFDLPNWKANWSSASDENLQTRISTMEVIETSINANEPAMRKLVMAYTMASALGLENLNGNTFETVMAKTAQLAGEATAELNIVRGRVGFTQERLDKVRERLSLQQSIVEELINERESVDAYEAATRVNLLSNQLQTAYTLTGRLQQLSLLNFL